MGDTKISWTDKVWNPTRGCSLVSPGCHQCYAMTFAHRFSGPGQRYEGLTRLRPHKQGPVWTGRVNLVYDMLEVPRAWKKPQRVFVNSMSDLFHEELSFEEIGAVFGVMAGSPQHTFQVLTKRPQRMVEFFRWVESQEGVPPTAVVEIMAANLCDVDQLAPPWPLSNVWLGVSIEDQRRADERIPLLLQVPAAVRFLSCEPLLESLDFGIDMEATTDRLGLLSCPACRGWGVVRAEGYDFDGFPNEAACKACHGSGSGIGWCIVGGESGPKARPFVLQWASAIQAACETAGVAFFFKQAGSKPFDDTRPVSFLDRAGADPLEWPLVLQVQEFPSP